MSLYEVKLEIPVVSAEPTHEVLLELQQPEWSVLEDAIAQRAWVVGLFGSAHEADERTRGLLPLLPSALVCPPAVRELAESDWRDSYKLHFHPWQFGRLHWVPVWHRQTYQLPSGHHALWLDPGMAFGTGNHETTRLCVERLVAYADRQGTAGRIVDAGCGSGILALSAARLGFRQVYAFDNDPEAVHVSQENAVLNELAPLVEFRTADLVSGLHGVTADLLMANILADVLMRFAPELVGAVAPQGVLVLSGILAVECERVRSTFAALKPDWPQESRTLGEWSDVVMTRPA